LTAAKMCQVQILDVKAAKNPMLH